MPIIDTAQLLEQIEGDDELLQETNDMLSDEAPTCIAGLREALAGGDYESLNSLAHTAKGMLANFFATAASETAYRIECQGNGDNVAETRELIDLLQEQMATMQAELRELIASRAS